jgi:flagellar protein FlaE
MTINPRDYDLDELRKMARERGDEPRSPSVNEGSEESAGPDMAGGRSPLDEGGASPSRDRFESGLYRELLPLEAGADGLQKPYLAALPETYAAEFVVFEWLEFLLGNFGFKGANEALQYYESVGWITEDVESTLHDYLLGIEDRSGVEQYDLDTDDHKLSLVYIARLVSMV